MAKKIDKKNSESSRTDSNNKSIVNPLAPARRRLLRALGGSGGAALTLALASRWEKPVVESMLLPAHAQASGLPSNTPCPISLEATFGPTSTNSAGLPYSVSLAVFEPGGGTTYLGPSAAGTGGIVTLAGSSTFPVATGSYSLGIEFSAASLASFAASYNASCCNESRANPSLGFIGFVTGSSNIRYVTISDGSCTFLNP